MTMRLWPAAVALIGRGIPSLDSGKNTIQLRIELSDRNRMGMICGVHRLATLVHLDDVAAQSGGL